MSVSLLYLTTSDNDDILATVMVMSVKEHKDIGKRPYSQVFISMGTHEITQVNINVRANHVIYSGMYRPIPRPDSAV